MHLRMSFRPSLNILLPICAIVAVLSAPGFVHAQSGIELEVEGDSIVDEDLLVEGNLSVLGQITAGSSENVLTDA